MRERGFSLLEVMVALALASVLAVAAFTVFFNSQRATGRVQRVIENRQNSRTAIQLMERDLRMAGSGWGEINVDGCYGGTAISVAPVTPFYGGSDTASDTLGIIGGWDAATSLKSAMANTSSNIVVKSVSGFATNDFCVVTNGEVAHLFQVTGVNSSTLQLSHATSSPYNVSGGHLNWPAGGYKVGAKVYRASWASYQVDTLSNPRDQLVRWTQGSTRQVVAYNVAQFRVSYLLTSDTLVRNPDDITEIEQVRPVLCMKTTTASTATATDSSWAMVRPRSW